ncbi:hypothetical protein GJ654_12795 [Rhodoblastus acidophilus]|uniref:Uncharacterized protein n=1 Tax=Rhodoblastus acidophilus TaxID=1074 RepID=A0A6N8DRQ0_RHOAC|nr:hypothetical protein [Rhodoblastus acidophilus]MCW2275698.1 hypothetical protein [Rhodoblastus acidophilus]MTV31863.1 hypothetical protein [Rhodoblastus acidophilus]
MFEESAFRLDFSCSIWRLARQRVALSGARRDNIDNRVRSVDHAVAVARRIRLAQWLGRTLSSPYPMLPSENRF